MKQKKAFTLVEIIISTIILTGGVFGIYKLLSINTNNLNNYDNQFQINSLFGNMQECIKSIGYSGFSAGTGSFNFGADNKGCFTGSYNPTLSFSGVRLDNKDYFLYGNASVSANKIDWKLFIEEASTVKQEKNFVLYK
ncbi:MAG: hypothetical protein PHG82_00010 [Candidatus Gracilibacteria bacterium]|nr:hypothetical protein [Candidatus Gracilibacteria bacterium]